MPLETGKMHPEDERQIRENIVKLNAVDPSDLAAYFLEAVLFDFIDLENIRSYNPNTLANRWRVFEPLLFNCGPRAYKTLLLALEQLKYTELANSIRTTQSAAPNQCGDAENRFCSYESLQSELVQLENELERTNSQNGRTIEISPLNDGDHQSSSSQLSSPNNDETSSQSDVSNKFPVVSNYSTRSQSYQILSLNQALAKKMNENVTIRVMQVDVREQCREPKFMMVVTVADESQGCRLILYNDKYAEWLSNASHSLHIANAINKQSHLVVTSMTVISIGQKFKIPPAVLDCLKERHQTVKTALSSPEGKVVSVQGKVSKISLSPCKKALYNRMESLTVVAIKDSTAAVNVSLWGPEAENIQKGQVLALENVKVKLFNNEKRLTNTPTSTVKVISNAQLSQLSEDDDEDENLKTGKLIGLIEVELYSSCPVMRCRNKKLIAAEKEGMLMCPKHGQLVAPEAAHLHMYAKFHVQTSDNKICALVAFLPILKLLLEANEKNLDPNVDKQILERDIHSILPFPLRFHEKNGIIESVCSKRSIQP